MNPRVAEGVLLIVASLLPGLLVFAYTSHRAASRCQYMIDTGRLHMPIPDGGVNFFYLTAPELRFSIQLPDGRITIITREEIERRAK